MLGHGSTHQKGNERYPEVCMPACTIDCNPSSVTVKSPFMGLTFKRYFRGFDGNYIAGKLILTAFDSDMLRSIKKAVLMSMTLQKA